MRAEVTLRALVMKCRPFSAMADMDSAPADLGQGFARSCHGWFAHSDQISLAGSAVLVAGNLSGALIQSW